MFEHAVLRVQILFNYNGRKHVRQIIFETTFPRRRLFSNKTPVTDASKLNNTELNEISMKYTFFKKNR